MKNAAIVICSSIFFTCLSVLLMYALEMEGSRFSIKRYLYPFLFIAMGSSLGTLIGIKLMK